MKQLEVQCRQWARRFLELIHDEKRRVNLLVAAGALGLLLLAFSEWFPEPSAPVSADKQTASVATPQDYAGQLEGRLRDLISHVEGAGAVEVMVTLENDAESVYATDEQTSADGSVSVNHVLLADEGLLETTQTPQVRGVAVVCEGGDIAAVRSRISTLVEVLTGVGANHVTVTKMAVTE